MDKFWNQKNLSSKISCLNFIFFILWFGTGRKPTPDPPEVNSVKQHLVNGSETLAGIHGTVAGWRQQLHSCGSAQLPCCARTYRIHPARDVTGQPALLAVWPPGGRQGNYRPHLQYSTRQHLAGFPVPRVSQVRLYFIFFFVVKFR